MDVLIISSFIYSFVYLTILITITRVNTLAVKITALARHVPKWFFPNFFSNRSRSSNSIKMQIAGEYTSGVTTTTTTTNRPRHGARACVIWFSLSPIFIEEVVDSASVSLAGREIRRHSIETELRHNFVPTARHYIWSATCKSAGIFATPLTVNSRSR